MKLKTRIQNGVIGARETLEIFIDELKLIFTDAGAVLLFVIALFIYPVLYSIGYQKETLKDIPLAVVDLDHTTSSRKISRLLDATEQISVMEKPASLKEAEALFYQGTIKGVLLIPSDFEKNILSGKAIQVTIYCDASYFLIYKQVFTGSSYATGAMGAGVELRRFLSDGKNLTQALESLEPVQVNTYNLYNPAAGYGSFVIPGIILIIMQQTLLIGIGMLGGTIREKKLFGEMMRKAHYHLGGIRLVIGKSSAYVLIYLFNTIFAMGLLHHWLNFPDNTSLFTILALLIPFLYSVSFLGLALSMLFKERVHSMIFLVFLSPIVLFLSGLSWPAQAIPPFLYGIAHIFPTTLMIPVYLKVRIMGADLFAVHHAWGMLLLQMIFYFFLACWSYRYAIRKYQPRT